MARRLTRSVIIGLLFFIPFPLQALPENEARQLAARGLHLLLAREYRSGRELIEAILQRDRKDLLGWFGILAYAQLRNFENYDFRFEGEYSPWAPSGRQRALEAYRTQDTTAWNLLVAGGILGVSAFQKVHHRRWVTGLWDAQLAIQALRRSLAKDPKGQDPLLGIGLYNYWRSHYTRALRILPFFPDRRREGREQLLLAVSGGGLTPPLARISLAFMDFHARNYRAVLEVTRALLADYPANIIIRMLEGQAYLEMKAYAKAREDFQRILAIDPSITKGILFLGITEAREGKDPQKARALLQQYLELDKDAPSHWKKPAEELLRKL